MFVLLLLAGSYRALGRDQLRARRPPRARRRGDRGVHLGDDRGRRGVCPAGGIDLRAGSGRVSELRV